MLGDYDLLILGVSWRTDLHGIVGICHPDIGMVDKKLMKWQDIRGRLEEEILEAKLQARVAVI